jgi:hypothetical protein
MLLFMVFLILALLFDDVKEFIYKVTASIRQHSASQNKWQNSSKIIYADSICEKAG